MPRRRPRGSCAQPGARRPGTWSGVWPHLCQPVKPGRPPVCGPVVGPGKRLSRSQCPRRTARPYSLSPSNPRVGCREKKLHLPGPRLPQSGIPGAHRSLPRPFPPAAQPASPPAPIRTRKPGLCCALKAARPGCQRQSPALPARRQSASPFQPVHRTREPRPKARPTLCGNSSVGQARPPSSLPRWARSGQGSRRLQQQKRRRNHPARETT